MEQLYKHPQYEKSTERRATYKDNWAENLPIDTEILISEGLFFTGKADRVVCFSCGSGFLNLTSQDNIVKIHLTSFPTCKFLIKNHNSSEILLLKEYSGPFTTEGKIFSPKFEDFVIHMHSTLMTELKSIRSNFTLVKAKYRRNFSKAVESVQKLKDQWKIYQLALANSRTEISTLHRQLSNVVKQLECPICLDKKISFFTNCGHGFCADCMEHITICSKCRSTVTSRTRVYL